MEGTSAPGSSRTHAISGERGADSVSVRPRRYPKWKIWVSLAAEIACGWLGGRRIYRAMHLRRGRFLVREECIEVKGLASELDGFRIAQLSDLHAGRFVREGDLAAVVDAVNEAQVDAHVLTGDYITHMTEDALRLSADLARLRSRHGGFAVFGNHDYRGRQEGRIAASFAQAGIRFLRNDGVRLEVGAASLVFTGVEDLEEGKVVDIDRARALLRDGDHEVLLCHNPRGAELLGRPGCVAVLSGHTHGGQIAIPGLRGLINVVGPSHPGERVLHDQTTLIVSRGIGVVALPIRFRAPAEVVIVELRRKREESDDAR